MPIDQTSQPIPLAPVGGRLSDVFSNPAVRHAAQTIFSVAVMFASIWLSAKLGIPLPITPPVVAAP